MVLHPPSGTAFDVGHLLVVDAASLAFAGKATESQQSVYAQVSSPHASWDGPGSLRRGHS